MPISPEPDGLPVLDARPFDPRSADQVRRLTDLYRAYLHEELERTGYAVAGLPVAAYLNTFLVWLDDDVIGFYSLDFTRYAVELIYLEPQHRGKGIARAVFTRLKMTCPVPMRAKVPLSPSGQALVDSVGIGVTEPTDEEEQSAAESLDDVHRVLSKECNHKRGNPARPCRRCYRRALSVTAETVVSGYATVARTAQILGFAA
ncbi:GNAT family N-acetyltransferase [Streptomyces sp. ME08-AFT2]|uniref:GNAT family N-acetyltransferase n=1 Tax=Streptomyces sp. ME08-AFT2 TaxID=3028683 RepID=UPI0029BEE703|nr:GNAT family N-acetyltransferase [Streptomyces sp. ME08-AFT2]MDX3314565.1 GNAT family N-acetyltransferase [Streptomyces sp. ME08-AFT2]